jgi:hypothetical protein
MDTTAQATVADTHVCWQNFSEILAELGSRVRYDPSSHNGWTPMTPAWFAPSVIKDIPLEYNNGCYWKMCAENGRASHMVLGGGRVCLDVPLADAGGNWIRRDLCVRCWNYRNEHVMDKRPFSPLEFVLMCNTCAATASAAGFTPALAFAKRKRAYKGGGGSSKTASKCDYVLAGDDVKAQPQARRTKDAPRDEGQQDILVMFQKRPRTSAAAAASEATRQQTM